MAVKLLHAALAADDTFLAVVLPRLRAAGALNHPNIVAVCSTGVRTRPTRDAAPPVTEYLGGGSRRLPDRSAPARPLMVGPDTARAWPTLIGAGWCTATLKPGNLLFDTEGGWGWAFRGGQALAEAAGPNRAGTMLGTAPCAAGAGDGSSPRRSPDVYSLALVLIERHLQVPFAADTTTGVGVARTQGDLEVPDDLPVRGTLERAGRLDPSSVPRRRGRLPARGGAEHHAPARAAPLVATSRHRYRRAAPGRGDRRARVTALDAASSRFPEDAVTGR